MRRLQTLSLLSIPATVLFPAAIGIASAQEPSAAFDTLTVRLQAVANVNRNILHRFWDPSPGLEVNVQTPFNFGQLEAGLHYAGFDGRTPDQPDFRAFFPYLGWGYDAALSNRFSWYNGLRVGSFLMTFDIGGNDRTEQELGLGLVSRLSYRLGGAWTADLSGRYRVVFTHERLHLVFLAAGVGRAFDTPNWLKALFE